MADASEIDDLRNILMAFRMSELQMLLGFAQRNKSGRKSELQDRALALLTRPQKSIINKIKELHKTIQQQPDSLNGVPVSSVPHVTSTGPSTMRNNSMMPGAPNLVPQVPPSQIRTNNNYQQMMYRDALQGRDAAPTRTATAGTVYPPAMYYQNKVQNFPIHTDVRFKHLPFFDVIAELLKPSNLIPQSAQRVQECHFTFHLTPQQATEITTTRDLSNGNKVEYVTQVQLRFCVMETTCEQEDSFPANIIVKVNNKPCPLPNPIPTNRPNVEAKRPPRPVNITNLVKLSPTVSNNVSVSWVPEYNKPYTVTIALVKKLTSYELLQRLKVKGLKPPEFSRGIIKEKLSDDTDEIATTFLNVSLTCPLGKIRMTTPCRASTCSHLQCFDASLFLQMNEKKATWICPVCDKPALYNNLMIDGYFQELLVSSKFIAAGVNEVILLKDGSWGLQNNDNSVQKKSSKPSGNVEIISDDLEIISVEDFKADEKPSSTTAHSKIPTPPPTVAAPNESVVDLTVSDSEDDTSTKKIQEQSQQPVVAPQSKPDSTASLETRSCRYGSRTPSNPNISITPMGSSSVSSSGYRSPSASTVHSTSSSTPLPSHGAVSAYHAYPPTNTTLAHQGSYPNSIPQWNLAAASIEPDCGQL